MASKKQKIKQQKVRKGKKRTHQEIHVQGTPERVVYDIVKTEWFEKSGAMRRKYLGNIPFNLLEKLSQTIPTGKYFVNPKTPTDNWYDSRMICLPTKNIQKIVAYFAEIIESSYQSQKEKLRVDLRNKDNLLQKILYPNNNKKKSVE